MNLKLLLSIGLLSFAAACDPGEECINACPLAGSSGSGVTEVSELKMAYQLDEDPWTAVFALTFDDPDGGVKFSKAHIYIGGSQGGAPIELNDIVAAAGLNNDSTTGTIGLPIRFGDTTPDGATAKFGIQLEDLAGKRSNCYSLALEFDVQ